MQPPAVIQLHSQKPTNMAPTVPPITTASVSAPSNPAPPQHSAASIAANGPSPPIKPPAVATPVAAPAVRKQSISDKPPTIPSPVAAQPSLGVVKTGVTGQGVMPSPDKPKATNVLSPLASGGMQYADPLEESLANLEQEMIKGPPMDPVLAMTTTISQVRVCTGCCPH